LRSRAASEESPGAAFTTRIGNAGAFKRL
jgi:hypothetical protein